MAAILGKPLMPWQRQVVDVALELEPDGTYAYDRVLVTVPRQSGKTTLLKPVMVHRALNIEHAGIWLTAQTRNVARDIWCSLAEDVSDSVFDVCATIRRANGSEALTLPGRSTIRPFPPSEEGLHSKTADLVYVDEIWSLSAEHGSLLMQAVLPTMLTRPMAQLWMTSTAGTARSGFMRPLIDLAREALLSGAPTRTAYFEWSIDENADPMDLDLIIASHPAWGHTVTRREALAFDPMMMTAAEYARAYANVWVSSTSFYLAPAIWERARSFAALRVDQPVAFACEVLPDRSGAWIVAAGWLPDGRWAIEPVEYRNGIAWCASRLLDLVTTHHPVAVVIDHYGPARTVHAALTEQYRVAVPLRDIAAADFVQADAEFTSGMVERTGAHRSAKALDKALAVASTKNIGDQVVLARSGDAIAGYPAALVAGMLAVFGLRHPPETLPAPDVR